MSSTDRDDLPGEWAMAPLSKVALVTQGQSPPGSTYNTNGEGLPFFQGKAEFGDISPTATKWCTGPKKVAEPGDVLISIRAPVGPTNLADGKCCIGRGLAGIRGYGGMPSRYLLYYLRYTVSELARLGTGTTFKAISGAQLRNHLVVVPPLPEQQRIVGAIETEFTKLDAAVTGLERVQANLKRYRASVLKAAVEGWLVPTEAELAGQEGRDYEPAKVLLNRILAERRRRWEETELARLKAKGKAPTDDRWKAKDKEPLAPRTEELPNLPDGWCWATLDQLLVRPLANGRSVRTAAQGFPVLRLTALKGDRIDLKERKVGEWTAEQAESYRVERGDFLVSRGNGSINLVGRGGLVDSEPDPVAYPDTLIRVRVNTEGYEPRLFAIVWNSLTVRSQVERKAKTTAGIHKVNQHDLVSCVIPLPPKAEQSRLLEEIEKQFSIASDVEHAVPGALSHCGGLRRSILAWAFAGKLVDQDPSDEPAGVLLSRIREQREREGSTKKARGRRRQR